MDGWFKFHRVLFDKPIWITSTPEQKTILITIMGMVNFKENEWEFKGEKFIVKPGQCITSLESIAEKSGKGITIQNVRTSLKRFEKYGFLTNESTNKNRLITVVNWAFYQGEEDEPNKQTNKQLTSNQQAVNKQLTTNKESNKERMSKNDNKKDSSPKYEICDLESAKLLFSLMQQNNPDVKEPNFEKWADDIRKLRALDNRPTEKINKMIRWTQQDSFWSMNILSPDKLRKKWDQLALKANNEFLNRKGTVKKSLFEQGEESKKRMAALPKFDPERARKLKEEIENDPDLPY